MEKISQWLFYVLVWVFSFFVRIGRFIGKTWLRFRKWHIVLSGAILIMAAVFANHVGSLRIFYRWAFDDVFIYGATIESRILILETIRALPERYRKAIISVDVAEHLSPFIFSKKSNADYESRGTRGVTLGRRIFIKPKEVTNGIVEHEAMHVFHNTVDNSFNYAWDAFSLKIPADKNAGAYKPKGFLSDIGLDSIAEDVADFGKECLNYLANKNKYNGSLLMTNHRLRGGYDPIFKLKINLMYRYGFFDKNEYDQLVEFVEKIK